MHKKTVHNSVIHKWLLSYIFILIIPLVIFTGSMMKFLTVYEDEIKYSNSLILEQSRLQMDQVLYEAKSFVAEISIDPMVRKLLTIDHKSDVTQYDLYDATKIMNRILLTKNEQFEFLVYFPRPDIVVSNYSYNDSEDYFNIYLAEEGLKKEQWDSYINRKYSSTRFFSYQYVEPSGKTSSRIVMIYPIMLEKHNGMYANIVVFLEENRLIEYENELFGRDTFLILDDEDKVLYGAESLQIDRDGLNYTMLGPGSNSMNMNIAGEKVIVSYISSKAADWKYIIITEAKSYMGQLIRIKSSMYLSVLLCCVVGGLIILYLLKRNYNPLKSVVKSIEESQVRSNTGRMNEFQYIAQTIHQLQSEKRTTIDLMKQKKNTFNSQMILNLVENRDIRNEIDLQILETYDIKFQSELFLVLTFLIHDGEGPFPNDNDDIDEKEKYKMICLIFQNITEELLGDKNIKAFFFHTGRLLGFIINPLAKAEDEIFNDIAQQLEQINKSINKYFLIRFTSACSDIHHSWENIPAAYSEALQVIEYNSMLNRDHIVFYHDLSRMPKEENFLYPEEMENHIINNLKIGNEEIVCETIHKIIAMNIEKNITPVTIRYLVVNIVGSIIKVVNQMEKKYQMPQLTFQTLFQENNISILTGEVEKNVHTICELVNRQNTDRNKPQGASLYDETLNFVKKHYADKGLSVNMIADELGVHIVHLSRTFMEYNGGSLSDYITGIRLAEARKLIRTGQKLETISENVGFGSLRTFMRVFKKYEGVTPGQFKETMERQ